jgi:hypothetical protein
LAGDPHAHREREVGRGIAAAFVDELHRDEHAPLVHADIPDRDDVGVAELRERLRLTHEPSAAAAVAAPVVAFAPEQQLERDLAVELRIVRRIHDTHRTRAELGEHDVAPDGRAARRIVRGGGLRASGGRRTSGRHRARCRRRHRVQSHPLGFAELGLGPRPPRAGELVGGVPR